MIQKINESLYEARMDGKTLNKRHCAGVLEDKLQAARYKADIQLAQSVSEVEVMIRKEVRTVIISQLGGFSTKAYQSTLEIFQDRYSRMFDASTRTGDLGDGGDAPDGAKAPRKMVTLSVAVRERMRKVFTVEVPG